MSEATDRIQKWIEEIEKSKPVEWDRLPEIYLYMDQVLTYMNKQLQLYARDENSNLLTSSMINNYVKDGVLPRPEQKKIFSGTSCDFNRYLYVKASSFHSGYFLSDKKAAVKCLPKRNVQPVLQCSNRRNEGGLRPHSVHISAKRSGFDQTCHRAFR
jgi:hypothetical protein